MPDASIPGLVSDDVQSAAGSRLQELLPYRRHMAEGRAMTAPLPAYRVIDLAARWQCSPNTVRAMIRRGELKPLPFCGKLIRVSQGEVEKWEAGEVPGSAGIEAGTPSSGTRAAADDAVRSARMIAQAPRPGSSSGNVSVLSARREGR
jgi:hypothetical protein